MEDYRRQYLEDDEGDNSMEGAADEGGITDRWQRRGKEEKKRGPHSSKRTVKSPAAANRDKCKVM